jgi:hypothetical protein
MENGGKDKDKKEKIYQITVQKAKYLSLFIRKFN